MMGRARKPAPSALVLACGVGLDRFTLGELVALVRSTDDRANLFCSCQRAVWADIARRGGVT